MLHLASVPLLLGLTAGAALMWVAIAMAGALLLALVAASMSTDSTPSTPPPPDPQSCITTLAGSIDEVRAGLPPGDHRSWSDHGRTGTQPGWPFRA